jgi:hypothetical protein
MISNLNAVLWQAARNPLFRYLGESMTEVVPKKIEGQCLWEWFDTETARAVPCTHLSTFLMFLDSPGTYSVRASALSSTLDSVDLQVFGPVCDDANLPDCEKEGRLRAEYRLSKSVIHDPIIGLSEASKRMIVDVIQKKGANINMKLFHAATGLPRVS